MTVISDNSPLSVLAEIGLLDVLGQLYGAVMIPMTVHREASHPKAPEALRRWMAEPPAWLNIVPDPMLLPETASLDAGEAAAISLAWQHRQSVLVIVDDKAARKLCEALALQYTGAAGVLAAAARLGLIDFEAALQSLQATSFRLGTSVVEDLRRRVNQPP